MKRPWLQIPVQDKIELMKHYRGLGYSYRDAIYDFEDSLKKYEEGGKLTYEIYEEQTGKPWSTAAEENLTDGSYEQNMQLRAKLVNNEFNGFSQTNSYNDISFSEAFKKARALYGSEGIFEWNGKKYNTKYKEELENSTAPSFVKNDKEFEQSNNKKEYEDLKFEKKNANISTDTFISPEEIDKKIKEYFITKPLNEIKINSDNIKKDIIKTEANSNLKTEDPVKSEVSTIVKEQLKEEKNESWYKVSSEYLSNLYENILHNIVSEIDTFSKNVDNNLDKITNIAEDIFKYGKGWINKVLMEETELVKAKDKTVAVETFNTKEKQSTVPLFFEYPVLQNYSKNPKRVQELKKNKDKVFNEEEGYKGKNVGYSLKADGDIHSFTNAFNNSKGYDYTPIPNIKNHTDTTYNSPGVAHFLLDSDVSQKDFYKHEYAQSMINAQLNGINIQKGSTVTEQYFPIGIKTKEGKINVKYKTKNEFTEIDEKNIIAPLRQYKYSDFDWDKPGVKTNSFNNSVVSVPVKNSWLVADRNGNLTETKESHLIYAKAIGKKAYGDFSGTAVVFILNKDGERLIIDYGNSVENIHRKAKHLIEKYKIPEDELIIGVHDLGSFNSKPVGKNGKLKYNPKSFNINDYTGGALAF